MNEHTRSNDENVDRFESHTVADRCATTRGGEIDLLALYQRTKEAFLHDDVQLSVSERQASVRFNE